jgi:glycogen operon protein
MNAPELRLSRIREGLPYPLGATWDGQGVNFALATAHATKVEVCLFDKDGKEKERIVLPEYRGETWHGYVPDIGPARSTATACTAPMRRTRATASTRTSWCSIPYALAHFGSLTWDPALFAYKVGDPQADLSYDERDSAPFMPKCVVVDADFDWKEEKKVWRPVPWDRTILYETHVRGFTKLHPKVPENQRGTYAGMAVKEVIEYVKSLGVTSVELLPIIPSSTTVPAREKLTNYWGYNSIGFFAPDPRYAADPSKTLQEFKEMVARFHDAGPRDHHRRGLQPHRGRQRARADALLQGHRQQLVLPADAGQEALLHQRHRHRQHAQPSHPLVIQMVCDSLRYWAEEMHVDGFRFDLGTILAREPGGFDTHNGFMKAVMQDPAARQGEADRRAVGLRPGRLPGRRLPAGLGGVERQVPRHGARLLARRSAPRRSRRGCAARRTCSTAAAASPGRASTSSPRTTASRSTTSVTYNDKHNEANGEDNKDGHSHNRSWNHGAEGPTDDEAIRGLRKRQMKNMLATLLLSQGTPMLLAGDESRARRRATTTPTARTTRSAGSTGTTTTAPSA